MTCWICGGDATVRGRGYWSQIPFTPPARRICHSCVERLDIPTHSGEGDRWLFVNGEEFQAHLGVWVHSDSPRIRHERAPGPEDSFTFHPPGV